MNETDTKSDNSYEALLEAEPAQGNNSDTDDVAPQESLDPPKKPRRKYGKFALGFTALSALIIGGASGGGFVQYVMPYFTPSESSVSEQIVDLKPLETKITNLSDKNAKLETQVTRLDAAYKRLEKTTKEVIPVAAKPVDLSGLESRLDVLETAPKPTVIDESLVARLESLQDEGSPIMDLSEIEARLDGLETPKEVTDTSGVIDEKLQELYAKQTQIDTQIAELSAELKSLDDELSNVKIKAAADAINASAINAAPFPKQALLDALEGQVKKLPLLQRALGKHIKVKDPSDPAVLIDAIEADLADGNVEAALTRFDRLPPELRIAGQAWRDALN